MKDMWVYRVSFTIKDRAIIKIVVAENIETVKKQFKGKTELDVRLLLTDNVSVIINTIIN